MTDENRIFDIEMAAADLRRAIDRAVIGLGGSEPVSKDQILKLINDELSGSDFRLYRSPPKAPKLTEEQFMPRVNGEAFRCVCRCNVFRKHVDNPRKYVCNACGETYVGEPA